MPGAHATLSPSAAKRWINCPPSVKLAACYPETTSDYAEEGTLAHDLAETKLRKKFEIVKPAAHKKRLAELQRNARYAPEMDGHTDDYVDKITEIVMSFPQRPMIAIEQRVDFGHIAPGGFGRADCLIIGGTTLYVVDFKYGRGVQVDAEDNPQMRLYAIGALRDYAMLCDIQTVTMVIVQPRLAHISEATMTTADLLAWGESIKPIAQQAINGEGSYCSGDWCRFCPAKHDCRARAAGALSLLNEPGAPGTDADKADAAEIASKASPALTNDEIGRVLEIGTKLQAWVADLETYALSEVLAGRDVAGWKAVEGRSNRAIDDVDAAFGEIEAAGFDRALLYTQKPVTLTELEKIVGKKQLTELIGAHIIKPQGKPTLAPATDKRKAYAETKVNNFFGGNENEC